ncbi:apoptosis-stimulating of p53 protein 2-like [Ruditapes philippinarum]|uniref:apoptosis-stimulating of p53 protein 2-like n=1 Tax=Ruditapes philippinarum TaxID=129788 RepID=UPI00295BBDF5|nr:apoptosis-stimulating of p53 protein 2-like [Ruditapes philippinarum]
MYFALVSASSTDNVDPGVSDKDSSKGAERGQRNSSNSSINKPRDRLSTEIPLDCKLEEDGPEVFASLKDADQNLVNEDVDIITDSGPGPDSTENEGRKHHGSSGSSREARKSSSSSALPGGGVDMTLSELQEMAARQQQQIESQQQILVAKEQRLKYLKQQEQKQQQLASENDRLRKLRDKVEAQEMKLKKLRALRGQVEQQKASNGNLNYELESIKALFNEKEKELAMAVAKVEEMTRQLEEIRSGRVKASTNTQSPAALAELEKLKKELMIRNKLNENQSNKMASNRELLAKRKDELARMDNRIHELQMRLKKKRSTNAEMAEQNKNHMNKTNQNSKVINRPPPNIAAIEPFVQEPPNNTGGFGKKDPKYQSLPPSSKFMYSGESEPTKEHKQ